MSHVLVRKCARSSNRLIEDAHNFAPGCTIFANLDTGRELWLSLPTCHGSCRAARHWASTAAAQALRRVPECLAPARHVQGRVLNADAAQLRVHLWPALC